LPTSAKAVYNETNWDYNIVPEFIHGYHDGASNHTHHLDIGILCTDNASQPLKWFAGGVNAIDMVAMGFNPGSSEWIDGILSKTDVDYSRSYFI